MTTALRCENLTLEFGGLKAVDDVTCEIKPGIINALIGPNGAGKSTILNCISGIYKPQFGRITYGERIVTEMRSWHLARMGIMRSFQNVELFEDMTVRENLLAGWHSRLRYSLLDACLKSKRMRIAEAEAEVRIQEVAPLLGLEHCLERAVTTLPFGLQKLADIGRAIMPAPAVLLLDEPVAGMNSREAEHIGGVVELLSHQAGMTVVLVEHNMSVVMDIAKHIIVLNFGRKIAEGSPAEITHNPDVIEAYLGAANA